MKIWYVNPYAGGPKVGSYWRAFYLCKAWNKVGHYSIVITPRFHHLMERPDRTHGREVVDGVEYNFLPALRYKGNGLGRFFSMILFPFSFLIWGVCKGVKQRPDLIIYSSAHPFGYMSAYVLSKIFRSEIYFEVRDIWPLSLVEIAGFKKTHPVVPLLRFIERFAYRTSDAVISLLPGAKSHMIEGGMLENKFRYIPNGFSNDDAHLSSPSLTLQVHEDLKGLKDQGKFIFIYAGAIGEPNAMHLFVDALCLLEENARASLSFVVIGKGEQFSEVKSRCESESLPVSFYPAIAKTDVLYALSLADAGFFVMHDLPIYRFGISLNKLYDYMSTSLPIVAAYRSYNDPISESGCGFTVQPGQAQSLANAFLRMSNLSSSDCRAMGRLGYQFALQHFEYGALSKMYFLPQEAERLDFI